MKTKKVCTNIPEELLRRACSATNLNQTDALIEGLKQLIAQQDRKAIVTLKGRVKIDLNLDKMRERGPL